MIIDKDLEFSDAQAETTVTTHASTNDIDLAVAGNAAKELYLLVGIHTAPTSSGSATINIQLITSASANMAGAVTLWETGAVAYDNAIFALGKQFIVRIPQGALRYLRVNYVIGGAALTAGKFNAVLVESVDNYIGKA